MTQADAKRCLAAAQKIEATGKPRPRVGMVAVKATLLTAENAQRIYQALGRQSGGGAAAATAKRRPAARNGSGAGAAGTATASRGARAESGSRAGSRRGRQRKKAVDPRLVWIGIGSGVVLICAVMAMFWLLLDVNKEDENQASTTGPGSTSSAGMTPDQARAAMLGGDASQSSTPAVVRDPEAEREEKAAFEKAVIDTVLQANRVRGDNFGEALRYLEDLKSSNQMRYEKFKDVAQKIDESVAQIKQIMDEEVAEALKTAQTDFDAGNKADARNVLEVMRDKVDEATRAKLTAKLEELFGS